MTFQTKHEVMQANKSLQALWEAALDTQTELEANVAALRGHIDAQNRVIRQHNETERKLEDEILRLRKLLNDDEICPDCGGYPDDGECECGWTFDNYGTDDPAARVAGVITMDPAVEAQLLKLAQEPPPWQKCQVCGAGTEGCDCHSHGMNCDCSICKVTGNHTACRMPSCPTCNGMDE